MITQFYKEVKLLLADFTVVLILLFIQLLTSLFLWIFPDSSYQMYGVASSELYFETMNWVALLWVPALASVIMAYEYRQRTMDTLRLFPVGWSNIVWAKFSAAFLVIIVISIITSIHIYILNLVGILGIQDIEQTIISFIAMIVLFGCYLAISLYICSIVKQTMVAMILSILICFFFFQGFELISQLPSFWGTDSWNASSLSLSHHANLIARGVLSLSTILYIVSLIVGFNYLTTLYLNKISIDL